MAAGKNLSADVEVIDLRSTSTTPQPQLARTLSQPSDSSDSSLDDSNTESRSIARIKSEGQSTPIKIDEIVSKALLNGDANGDSITAIVVDATDPQAQTLAHSSTQQQSTKPKSKAAPRSPSPPPPPPAPPRPTIRLDIPLGGPENYEVDITRLSIDNGQLPDIVVAPVATHESDDESDDEDEKEKEKDEKTDGKVKRRGRKVCLFRSFYSLTYLGF